MKTKYIAVPVSERLPEKEGCYPIIFKNSDIIRDYYRGKDVLSEEFWKNNIEFWLEEKEDHSEEMLSLLEDVKLFFQPHPHFAFTDDQESTLKQIEELINKINNGKI
ncbi:hypothetical protein RG089_002840 [Elizabethkingia anophelis]|nr:hypothetical protein [Elizabethkingia anophelis]ELB1894333.1 hypothetical protein [Elizabethkingia anophelis]